MATAPTTTATAASVGLRRWKARAWATRSSTTRPTRRGTLAFSSMAARAAFNSARACSTGSLMPSGTAVRGTGTGASELIAHLLHVLGDRLDRVLPFADLAEAQDAEPRQH